MPGRWSQRWCMVILVHFIKILAFLDSATGVNVSTIFSYVSLVWWPVHKLGIHVRQNPMQCKMSYRIIWYFLRLCLFKYSKDCKVLEMFICLYFVWRSGRERLPRLQKREMLMRSRVPKTKRCCTTRYSSLTNASWIPSMVMSWGKGASCTDMQYLN